MKIRTLYNAKLSCTEIGKQLWINKKIVKTYLQIFKFLSQFPPKIINGRKCLEIKKYTCEYPTATLELNLNVYPSTLPRYLKRIGYERILAKRSHRV